MPNLSLMSFLNITSKATPQKVTEYGRYLTPGGYDFYWRLKDAARLLTVESKPFTEAAKPILACKKETERKHNLARFEALYRWLSRAEAEYFEAPQSSCSSPLGHLTVKVEPEFGMTINGKRRLVHLWSNQGTALKTVIAGVGIHLMNEHLLAEPFSDCSCVILDLSKSHQFASEKLPAHVSAMVTSEFAWADSFFQEAAKAA